MSGDAKSRSKTKQFIGDGKRIVMRTNSDSLLVIGSGNVVKIERNDGDIQVVGDGCRVSVTTGSGSIKYTGDGGRLHTGSMDLSKITYRGDGGKIISSDGTTKRYEENCVKSKHSSDKEKVKPKSETKVVGGNVYVSNASNCQIKIPSLKKVTSCIQISVPKIQVVTYKENDVDDGIILK